MNKYSLIICFLIFWGQCVLGIDLSRYRFHLMPETSYYGGIQSIAKDSLGRIWYTGPDALFIYDGNSFYQLNDIASAIKPAQKWGYGSLIRDKKGNLFLASGQGLLKFDYERFSFHVVVPGMIRSLCVHSDGQVYMLSDNSILRYNPQNKLTESFLLPKNKSFQNILSAKDHVFLSQGAVVYQVEMTKKRLIQFADFGSTTNQVNDAVAYRGLYYFLTQRGGIHVTDLTGTLKQKIPVSVAGNSSVLTKKLYLDQTGIIWVATQAGLFFYDPATESSSALRMNLNDAYSLPNNSIWTIYPDPDQGAWIGTYGGKIAYCSLYDSRVRYFKPSPGGLNHPIVSSFQEDHLGNIWIGTEGGSLNYWNRKKDQFTPLEKSQGSSLSPHMIKRLKFDRMSKKLLISAYNGGIGSYDVDNQHFSSFNFRSPESQQPLTVYDFVNDKEGTWWMTDPDKSFLYRRKPQGSIEMVSVLNAQGKKMELEVEALYVNNQDQLCLISHQGFFVVNPHTLKVLKHYVLKDASYSANYLCSYTATSNGEVWLGTLGKGVNVLRRDGTYVNYSVNNGFPAKMVFGILEDVATKNIWLSTSDGLFCFNWKSSKFEKARFYQENNIGSFYIHAAYKTSRGEMLFGGTNGFLLFDPAYLNKNLQKPKVFFTGFLVNNKLVKPADGSSVLTKDIGSLSNRKEDKIRLSSSQSNVEIKFSANSYLSAEKNQFAYRMLGLGEDWQISHANQKSVQFLNLPGGDYTFEIKASNNDGLWGDQISRLYIHVDPPFFLSWWAYCCYAALVSALLFFIMRYYSNKRVFKERLALERLKEQNMQELNQARTDFFTNISHDLKTPLTLVLQPLKQLKDTIVANDTALVYMDLIEKNVSRIQRMISQLLRFREIESQKITLNPQVGDFINFVRDLFSLFELYANKKGVETNISAYKDNLYVAFDYDVIEKILTNLFSNALKYTPDNGYVGVRIYSATAEEKERFPSLNPTEIEYISIEVINTGDCFSEEQIAMLYTSFNRLSSHRPTFEESSGLGLAIVKELVDVLEGKIWMVNKTDKISFTISLPLRKQAGAGDMQPNVYDYTVSEIDDIIMQDTAAPETRSIPIKKTDNILLIEDDQQLRVYLEQRLAEKYNVYTASDGEEGLIKAEKIYPQLIITDLIMPNRNGLEVCRSLRQNFKTSHIPIIMISGTGDDNQHKIKALEYGANVFIDKPFHVDYLLQQTETILRNQRELKEKYSKHVQVDPSNVTVTSMDEELLIKAIQVIEENIDNASYSVEDFVADMNVGRTILYQKIHDIVGMSIKEFILNMRLKRSAYLLEKSDLTIAEVAYQTGFNNAKYFSVCFKKQFELSPSEFKKKVSSGKK
ncbi:hybrid sensor histidine kinase/response regulator transcription factor [Sphingobacterium sp. HMSC13C05]|uniref:hybrid sensor histidine kinase/response regulator transcription factor n=1 Tax=Sphingobacterium sp. HMSC13C05 TaxID=1581095 RepID=UPI000B30BC08|nr:hybrid sensor histidine kinase/response regulator transcription factor [Sphingobacterium sp. HMSC13C05]